MLPLGLAPKASASLLGYALRGPDRTCTGLPPFDKRAIRLLHLLVQDWSVRMDLHHRSLLRQCVYSALQLLLWHWRIKIYLPGFSWHFQYCENLGHADAI